MDRLRNILAQQIFAARHKLATAAVGLLILVVAYHVLFGANGLLVYRQKRQQSRNLQEQIQRLQDQNGSLEQQIKALKSDPQAIEKEAREHLRYARPGEVIYTLPAPRPGGEPLRK
ncbi:MAG TPA: septum formation initiator family protein [Candidatus Angelobacter sp.]|nr:septum formation initiator family protein [Candidatus Angelobacter sp.]